MGRPEWTGLSGTGQVGSWQVLDTPVTAVLDGRTLSAQQRVDNAFAYLLSKRYSQSHGLLFGGTTIDCTCAQKAVGRSGLRVLVSQSCSFDFALGGDVQPETNPGCTFDNTSHPAVDIYDNAMM